MIIQKKRILGEKILLCYSEICPINGYVSCEWCMGSVLDSEAVSCPIESIGWQMCPIPGREKRHYRAYLSKGCFCNFSCAKAYGKDRRIFAANELIETILDFLGPGIPKDIPVAPHWRTLPIYPQ